MSSEQLQAVSQKSCSVLRNLGSQIQWIESYVTGDKIYCIYRASNADLIQQHGVIGGFTANLASVVGTMIDPTSAET